MIVIFHYFFSPFISSMFTVHFARVCFALCYSHVGASSGLQTRRSWNPCAIQRVRNFVNGTPSVLRRPPGVAPCRSSLIKFYSLWGWNVFKMYPAISISGRLPKFRTTYSFSFCLCFFVLLYAVCSFTWFFSIPIQYWNFTWYTLSS